MVRTLCGRPGDKAVVIGLPVDFDLDQKLRRANQVFLATAFAKESGWKLIKKAVIESGAKINIVTGFYCCHTQPSLLWKWLRLIPGHPGLCIRLAHKTYTKFHPKVLIVCGDDVRFAIVGSGNLTSGGLRSNIECSIYTEEVGYVDALLKWFHEIESAPLSKAAILSYQPHYNQSLAPQKVLERAQRDAEQGINQAEINQAIIFRRRAKAIQAAKAYFESETYGSRKAKLNTIIPSIRKWLDYDAFNFDVDGWTQFYKTKYLGKIRETSLSSTVGRIATIRKALHFLFAKGQPIEERLSQLLDRNGNYHVHGIGINLVSKLLAAHDPKMWFVWNKRVKTTLYDYFGYESSGKGETGRYLAFVKAMRSFNDHCGAENCVALDAFFSDWYKEHCKVEVKRSN
jgi:hypothetical protein